ncbi:MAG TPA: epoxyqueuosine reductase QueH [Firmicutes bacterium]|jgi:predicted adenine nucleotide alpha hydrolase (AANH) superfamily ATPase|nr:epoxyqueuosine reductase QueH [Bacillota bacterium]HOQ25047.1 epoxyqueuosine reductase QueH [Bacillota bacterium]HPT68351.1 epoxyqueuosine reductase QueH [Bacillota bacterium]
MELLLHACCGPCAAYTTLVFAEEGIQPTLFYANPNIHPYKEWERRRDALKTLAEIRNLPLLVDEDYALEEFLMETLPLGKDRCLYCYRTRLSKTAQCARDGGFSAYSTTLLISPYQRHDLLREMGEEIGKQYGVEFLYRDLRPGFRQSQQMAREMGLYRQGYCGCILSEKERYCKPKKT